MAEVGASSPHAFLLHVSSTRVSSLTRRSLHPMFLQHDWTPLHFAAFCGSVSTLSLLLDDPRVTYDNKDIVRN